MDLALDFAILFKITDTITFDNLDFIQNEWVEIWTQLEPFQTQTFEENMYYRKTQELFCESKKVVPTPKRPKTLLWCHEVNNNPGPERTVLFFLQNFYSNLSKKALIDLVKPLLDHCEVCLKSKPNTSKDRGLVGALPIPSLANDIVYVDFV